ncbi:MAG: 4Fe-4S binding protein [Synergistaceae bacterium]|jgi:Pyruvate/2-oxoacid:ferredoxin oxidoreductase delta subunit|nr:4Fe-4S binding protein [Synergistaceae bacterium]
MNNAVFEKAMELYDVPTEFREEARLMLTDAEIEFIAAAGKDLYSVARLTDLITKNRISDEPEEFIRDMYHRAVLAKVVPDRKDPASALYGSIDIPFESIGQRVVSEEENRKALYRITDFYVRYPYFAQFEPEKYAPVSKEKKAAMNEWDLQVYMEKYSHIIRGKIAGIEEKMHQNDFLSLDEAMKVLEKNKDFIYILPCNCKMMEYYHDWPSSVCVRFYGGINTEYDRGYGERVSLEEAKKRVKEWNRRGLMQVGEGFSMCNCEGQTCYPVKMAKRLNTRLIYPKSNHRTVWHEEKCVSCKKCVQICNFQAFFVDDDKKVRFNEDKCWGCTICSSNCPRGAITLTPR